MIIIALSIDDYQLVIRLQQQVSDGVSSAVANMRNTEKWNEEGFRLNVTVTDWHVRGVDIKIETNKIN